MSFIDFNFAVCSQFCCTFFNNEISFIKLFHELRSSKNCADELKSVKKLRSTANNVSDFDKSLDKLINLFTIQPQQDYPDSKLIFQLSNIFFLFFSLSNIFFFIRFRIFLHFQSTPHGCDFRTCLFRLRGCYCSSRFTKLFTFECWRNSMKIM